MNTLVHMVIAKDIIKEVENHLNLSAKKLSFIYGSVRPDLRRKQYNTNHYKEDFTVNYVYDMMEKVFKEYKYNYDSKEFYVSLGEVIHFICDFFCYPHNSYYNDGRYKHHKYELKQTILLTERKSFKEKFDKNMKNLSFEEYKEYIEDLHKIYTKLKPDAITDYIYAYKACRCLVLSAIKIYVDDDLIERDKLKTKLRLRIIKHL